MIEVNASHAALGTIEGSAWFAAHLASGFTANTIGWEWARDHWSDSPQFGTAAKEAELQQQIPILRDIFGNVFRPPQPRTFPKHVLGLARSCYAAFPEVRDEFLILADALEEAGETTAAAHCREKVHVKGCHVIDLILGKS
jgi:hypothetical protein